MLVSIGGAALAIGVSVSTLRRWEREGRITPKLRTKGGHRRYDLTALEQEFFPKASHPDSRRVLAYARVSSHDQKKDLATQVRRLECHLQKRGLTGEVLSDLGSGINFKKPGLRKLVSLICRREVSELVVTHEDRLLRFGSELVFRLCEEFGTKVTILDEKEVASFEVQLARDVICLMTVFTARLYGKRSHGYKAQAA